MINFLKNHKKNIVVWGLVLIIFGLIFLIVYYENKDEKQMHHTISNINVIKEKLNKNAFNDGNSNILLSGSTLNIYNSDTLVYTTNSIKSIYDSNVDLTFLDLEYYESEYNYTRMELNFSTPVLVTTNSLFTYNLTYEGKLHIQFWNNNNIVFEKNQTSSNSNSLTFTNNFSFNMIRFWNPNNNMIGNYYLGASSTNYDYTIGFNDGYNSRDNEIEYLNTQIDELNDDLTDLQSNYSSLLEQYNTLNSGEFSLSSLIWDITAVPFNFIASGFNVNIMGLNIASIITGLFTACIIIWLFKKLFK